MMMKNTRMKDQLREEQLDMTTGEMNCEQCLGALSEAERHSGLSKHWAGLANKSMAKGNLAQAEEYKNIAIQTHNLSVDNLLQIAEHGHIPFSKTVEEIRQMRR